MQKRLNKISYFRIIHNRLVRLAIVAHSPQSLDFDRMKTYFTGAKSKGKMKIKEEHISRRHTLTEEYATIKQWWESVKPKLEEWEAELLERYDIMPDEELVLWAKDYLNKDWDKSDLQKRVYRIAAKLKRQEIDEVEEERKETRERKKRLEDVWEKAREYAKQERELKEARQRMVNTFLKLPKLF